MALEESYSEYYKSFREIYITRVGGEMTALSTLGNYITGQMRNVMSTAGKFAVFLCNATLYLACLWRRKP